MQGNLKQLILSGFTYFRSKTPKYTVIHYFDSILMDNLFVYFHKLTYNKVVIEVVVNV